jgi:hypothetical protein
MGPEWLGEYYETHPNDHAKDLEAALEKCLLRDEQDELRGLYVGATQALQALDGDGGGSNCSRSPYTPSLSHHLSSPEEVCLPENAVISSPEEQKSVEVKNASESPERVRKSPVHCFYHAIKHRVGSFRRWRWPTIRKKGKGEKERRGKTENEIRSSSGSSQQEEGKRK